MQLMVAAHNGSVLRSFEIFELFREDRHEISAAIVAAELGINAVTAHRYLRSLAHVGALAPARRGVYRLGYLLVDLGNLATASNRIAVAIQPIISSVADDLQETVLVSQFDRYEVLGIATASAGRPISVNIRVGRRFHAHATASGKIWLAHLPPAALDRYFATVERPDLQPNTLTDEKKLRAAIARIRADGFASNYSERESDISSVAVPIMNLSGKLFLTISIVGLAARFDQALIQRALKRLRLASNDIVTALYGK